MSHLPTQHTHTNATPRVQLGVRTLARGPQHPTLYSTKTRLARPHTRPKMTLTFNQTLPCVCAKPQKSNFEHPSPTHLRPPRDEPSSLTATKRQRQRRRTAAAKLLHFTYFLSAINISSSKLLLPLKHFIPNPLQSSPFDKPAPAQTLLSHLALALPAATATAASTAIVAQLILIYCLPARARVLGEASGCGRVRGGVPERSRGSRELKTGAAVLPSKRGKTSGLTAGIYSYILRLPVLRT